MVHSVHIHSSYACTIVQSSARKDEFTFRNSSSSESGQTTTPVTTSDFHRELFVNRNEIDFLLSKPLNRSIFSHFRPSVSIERYVVL